MYYAQTDIWNIWLSLTILIKKKEAKSSGRKNFKKVEFFKKVKLKRKVDKVDGFQKMVLGYPTHHQCKNINISL